MMTTRERIKTPLVHHSNKEHAAVYHNTVKNSDKELENEYSGQRTNKMNYTTALTSILSTHKLPHFKNMLERKNTEMLFYRHSEKRNTKSSPRIRGHDLGKEKKNNEEQHYTIKKDGFKNLEGTKYNLKFSIELPESSFPETTPYIKPLTSRGNVPFIKMMKKARDKKLLENDVIQGLSMKYYLPLSARPSYSTKKRFEPILEENIIENTYSDEYNKHKTIPIIRIPSENKDQDENTQLQNFLDSSRSADRNEIESASSLPSIDKGKRALSATSFMQQQKNRNIGKNRKNDNLNGQHTPRKDKAKKKDVNSTGRKKESSPEKNSPRKKVTDTIAKQKVTKTKDAQLSKKLQVKRKVSTPDIFSSEELSAWASNEENNDDMANLHADVILDEDEE